MRYSDGAPRWYVKHRWHSPERGREREADVNLRAEHRAGGAEAVEDADFDNRKPRNSAQWDWS